MKTENKNVADNLLEIVQTQLKENLLLKNVYTFQLKERRVKVIFSNNSKAPTIENVLVKIAINRGK